MLKHAGRHEFADVKPVSVRDFIAVGITVTGCVRLTNRKSFTVTDCFDFVIPVASSIKYAVRNWFTDPDSDHDFDPECINDAITAPHPTSIVL